MENFSWCKSDNTLKSTKNVHTFFFNSKPGEYVQNQKEQISNKKYQESFL
jgi:hypothetical protein